MKTTTTELDLLDHAAHNYSQARKLLSNHSALCKAEIQRVIKRHLVDIRKAASLAARAEAQLKERIEANPELFTKPRTMTLHGVKLGYQKGKGKTIWPDDAILLKSIHKHLKPEASNYTHLIETPDKSALLTLDAELLKKLGYEVTGTGDQILIKDSQGDVDKMVASLVVEFSKQADAEVQS